MDEQEKRETTEAQKQYTDTMEASKQAGAKRREEAEQRRAEE